MENQMFLHILSAIALYLVGGALWAYYSHRQRTEAQIEEEIRFYQLGLWSTFLLWVVWATCISCIRLMIWWRIHWFRKHF